MGVNANIADDDMNKFPFFQAGKHTNRDPYNVGIAEFPFVLNREKNSRKGKALLSYIQIRHIAASMHHSSS